MLALVLTALALPPLAPGVHRCGVQWSGYSEVCTVTVDGDSATIHSEGPSVRFEGTIKSIDATSFSLTGELAVTEVPIAYTDLQMCGEKGPFRFRHSGKRKFFRHTQTCTDMTTTYFDVFTDVVDPAALDLTKKLSAMAGKASYDTRRGLCAAVSNDLVNELGDPICQRWNDSGDGVRYFSCVPNTAKVPSATRIYVFDKASQCSHLRERKNPATEL
jgi:hypothetical protein